MLVVNAKDFKFTYPGVEESALNGVSFDIRKGEVLGIIGPIGAGKTTLCMAIARLAPRITGGEASGEISVAQNERTSSNQRQNENDDSHPVGMVFEDYAGQLTQLKALDEVKNPLLDRDFSDREAEEIARELLDWIGLDTEELQNKRVWELSGGQQQRLAIAATLALDPQILIFDKVIDRLDPRGQEKVRHIIEELAGEKTLVVVEQDTHLLQEIADRILVVEDGKVVAEGKPENILRNDDLVSRADVTPPTSLQVARALGLSDAPLTPEEFEQVFARNGNFQHESRRERAGTRGSTSDRSFGRTLVRVEHLTFCYPDGTRALNDVNFALREGEVHAIVGNSDAGKTTLVLNIAGLLKPTEGKVSVCDLNTKDNNATDLATKIGTVFQNPDNYITEQTVRDEIGFPLRERQYERRGLFNKRKRYDDNYIQDKISEACELVGIPEKFLAQDPVLLPAGLRRLITIAEVLTVEPQVISMDEPSVGLSASSRRQLKETIARFREMGKAILLTENDVDFVAEVADTVTIMARGEIVLSGSVREVFAKDNWEQLSELHIRPPHVTRLAQRLGIQAMTVDELVAKLSCQLHEGVNEKRCGS